MDSLGLDENGCPVILEYKRATNENVINQGLFYLDWLIDHRKDFEWLVLKSLGEKDAENVDWSAPRLICIAGDFTRYDEHAVKQMHRNIDLIRYRRFANDLLMLDLVATTAAKLPGGSASAVSSTGSAIQHAYKSIATVISELDTPMDDRLEALRAFLLALGDDVQESVLQIVHSI